jgi:hypothetical protein
MQKLLTEYELLLVVASESRGRNLIRFISVISWPLVHGQQQPAAASYSGRIEV